MNNNVSCSSLCLKMPWHLMVPDHQRPQCWLKAWIRYLNISLAITYFEYVSCWHFSNKTTKSREILRHLECHNLVGNQDRGPTIRVTHHWTIRVSKYYVTGGNINPGHTDTNKWLCMLTTLSCAIGTIISFWRNFHHCWHRKLPKLATSDENVIKIDNISVSTISRRSSVSNPKKATLLDVVLTDTPRRIGGISNFDIGMSDFHNITCASTKLFVPKTSGSAFQYRSYKKFDDSQFKKKIWCKHLFMSRKFLMTFTTRLTLLINWLVMLLMNTPH